MNRNKMLSTKSSESYDLGANKESKHDHSFPLSPITYQTIFEQSTLSGNLLFLLTPYQSYTLLR